MITDNNYQNGDTVVYTTHKDKYGGLVKEFSTGFYTRLDYDDGSFIITQDVMGVFDRVICFGPLKTNLSDLMNNMGFSLRIEGFKYRANQTLYLARGHERYKLTKIRTIDLTKYTDLVQYVKNATEPHYEPYISAQKQKEIKEVLDQKDPFEELMSKYPKKRNPVEFIGNQTLSEYVKQQLREQRRLENVE
jgi:hypothetical protein